jgi:hypothetical protein
LLPENGQLNTAFTDTLTVRLSTVQQDSVTTANPLYALAGRYVDPALGTLESRSYLRLASTDSLGYSVFNRFDSLVLYTRINYVYGDTTRAQRFRVHRLTESLTPLRRYQASDQVPYESAPVGTATVRPRFAAPGQLFTDSVKIRLSDDLGKLILSKAGLSETFKQNFPDWFKGLALVPNAGNTALLGFQSNSTPTQTGGLLVSQVQMILYYHREEPGRARENFSFSWFSAYAPPVYEGWSFNNLTTQRPGALATLTPGQKLPASRTNGRTYAQANTGLTTLIEIPYLDQFRRTATGLRTVNRVELVLAPDTAVGTLTAPTSFELIESDGRYQYARTTSNTLQYIVPDGFASTQQVLTPSFGLIDNRFTANLTLYTQSLLRKSKVNNGLLIRLNTAGVPRLALDASKIKLRVYYTEAPR